MRIEQEETDIEDSVNTHLYALSFNKSHLKIMRVLNVICKILAVILLFLGFILLMIGKYPVILVLILALPMLFMYKIQLMIVRAGLKKVFNDSVKQNGYAKTVFSMDQENTLYEAGKVSISIKTCDVKQIRETLDYFFIHLDTLLIVGINKKNTLSAQHEFQSYSLTNNIPYIIDNQWDNNPYKKYKK